MEPSFWPGLARPIWAWPGLAYGLRPGHAQHYLQLFDSVMILGLVPENEHWKAVEPVMGVPVLEEEHASV